MLKQNIRKALKQKAHHLKPVVMIGSNGLNQSVQLEIETALIAHELIKIRIAASDKKERLEIIDQICQERESEMIQLLGHIATIYRERPND